MDTIIQNHKINRTIFAEDKEHLFFSGTSYLGISASTEFSVYLKEGIDLWGISHGLSRINNVRLRIFEEFEIYFAHQAGADRALVFSSGFLAGQAISALLVAKMDAVFIAPDTHPAVLPNVSQHPTYAKAKDWIKAIQDYAQSQQHKNILILANAVDVLKPEIHDFSWVSQLPAGNQYTLLLDDSHALGLLGEGVFGTFSQWKDLQVRLLVSCSLGKGLGLPAGIVLGDYKTIQQLSEQAIFRGASPPPPAYLWAFMQSQEIYKKQQEKLKDNIQFFKKMSKGLKVNTTDEDFPVFRFEDPKLLQKLKENQIVVSSFPYPSPNDPPVHRIVISAWHEKEDLLALIRVLKN